MEDFKFSTLVYKRPDCEGMAAFAVQIKERIERAGSFAEVKEALLAYDERQKDFCTDASILHIRHTLDTTDTFYEQENDYIEHAYPMIIPQLLAVDEALMNSPYRAELEKEYGKQFFARKELEKKAFCEANIPLMQQEAKLCSEYEKLMATAKIPFDGKTLNLYGIQKYFEHEDRAVRRGAEVQSVRTPHFFIRMSSVSKKSGVSLSRFEMRWGAISGLRIIFRWAI